MAARFRHFAINADDVQRARQFYEQVFRWTFNSWGPPNFYQIRNAGTGLIGALQERRNLIPDQRASTFESTFEVEDLTATIAAVIAAGGKLVMQRTRIEGVGELIYFRDPEGNLIGAMQYDPGIWNDG
jgi:predicted enzyme related to lactoylglutathione lyase